ncbi:MAG: hypothetical protein K1X83_12355 [Oligoflexia bacterium]|nr:hypothetical protein [Oligoflexia bacterium]
MTNLRWPSYLLLLLSACSNPSPTPEQPRAETAPTVAPDLELLMSRAAIGMIEFEQYKLTSGQLYHECGQIKRGRYLALEQDLSPLQPAQQQRISGLVSEISQSLTQKPHKFPSSGTNSGIGDPGIFELKLSSGGVDHLVKTAVDTVAAQPSRLEGKTKLLAALLRGVVGKPICGNYTFYGIGQSAP